MRIRPTYRSRATAPARTRWLVALALLFVSATEEHLGATEWNGGSGWALFDVAERRSMWIWDMGSNDAGTRYWDDVRAWRQGLENYKGARDLCLDFCQSKSIRSIYVFNATWEWSRTTIEAGHIPNAAEWADLMAEATSRGIQVWLMGYLWDDPDDSRMAQTEHKESLKQIMQAIHAFNQAHPTTPIAGFHNDQEPGDAAVYDDLLDTMMIAQDWVSANAPGLMISQALRPVWRNAVLTWNGKTQSMNNHILDTIGHAAFMAYSDNPATVLDTYAKPACNHAAITGAKVAVGLEVGNISDLYPGAAADTWYEEIIAEPPATRFLADASAPVTFEDCLHGTAAALRSNVGYDRIVIHSYASYFNHWFSRHPRDYILALPGGTYDAAITNQPGAHLLDDVRPLVGLGPQGSIGTHNDSDGDTHADLLEIALGSDPHDTHSLPTIAVRIHQVKSPEGFALVWPGVAELHYSSLLSSNLTEWAPFTDWLPGSNGWNEIPVPAANLPSHEPVYFRLGAALP